MPDLIARYGGTDLPVIAVENGVPFVFHNGEVRPAAEIRVGPESLDYILHAPRIVPAPAGLWADFDWTHDGEVTRESFPVVALQIDASGRWGDGYIIDANGIEPVHEIDGGSRLFRGYRLGEPAPFCEPAPL